MPNQVSFAVQLRMVSAFFMLLNEQKTKEVIC